MQVVIDIPKKDYDKMCRGELVDTILVAIKNGKPLPKGHGDLKDVTSIPNEDKDIIVKSLLAPNSIAFIGAITLDEYINSLPTIVEADEEREEKNE